VVVALVAGANLPSGIARGASLYLLRPTRADGSMLGH